MKVEPEKNIFSICLCLCFLIIFFVSCSSKLIETKSEDQNISERILIASESSEFKDKLRKLVIDEFHSDYSIDVVNIDTLKNIDSGRYSVVLIIDTCMAWSGLNFSLKSFMSDVENREKTVLFITAGDPDWQYSYQEVDAITSASEIESEDALFRKIKFGMNRILKKNNYGGNDGL